MLSEPDDRRSSAWCYHCDNLVTVVYDAMETPLCYDCGNVIEKVKMK